MIVWFGALFISMALGFFAYLYMDFFMKECSFDLEGIIVLIISGFCIFSAGSFVLHYFPSFPF